jgi:hypothetical protein
VEENRKRRRQRLGEEEENRKGRRQMGRGRGMKGKGRRQGARGFPFVEGIGTGEGRGSRRGEETDSGAWNSWIARLNQLGVKDLLTSS